MYRNATTRLRNCHFWPELLPWSLPRDGWDSTKLRSSGLFRFFDICCSLPRWLIDPELNRCAPRNVEHLQPAGYKTHTTVWGRRRERISARFIQIPSVPSALFSRPRAQSYHAVAKRASGDAAWRHGAGSLLIPAVIRWLSRTDFSFFFFFDRWEIFAAEVICRSRVRWIKPQSDGNYALRQLVDPRP